MLSVLLEAQGLTKVYDGKRILNGIDLSIGRGRCIAFAGHNGSGKSTLLKALAGLIMPTSGSVSRAPGLTFGYVPEQPLALNLSARQYIRHMGRVEGMARREADAAMENLFDAFFLHNLVDVPMKNLSKGTQQKITAIQALLCLHDILLLDEPLSGQDAASQEVFIEKVQAALASGSTVLLSCHEAFLIERLADTVYELKDGKLRQIDAPRGEKTEMAVLIFERKNGAPLPTLPAECPVIPSPGQFTVRVPLQLSQSFLLDRLKDGYVLKEFHHENL